MASIYETRFQPGRFQANRFQIFSPGSSSHGAPGGTFSRGRWRKILEEKERERLEAERKKRDERLRKQAEARRRQSEEAEARRIAREAEKARGEAALDALRLAHADAAARGVDALKASIAQSELIARHGRMVAHREAMDRDDEEALMLLLSHHQ